LGTLALNSAASNAANLVGLSPVPLVMVICPFFFSRLFIALTVGRATQPCPGIKRGRTYLRPKSGTGMPTVERFRRAPCGARFQRCPPFRNFPFRLGQAEATLMCSWLLVRYDSSVLLLYRHESYSLRLSEVKHGGGVTSSHTQAWTLNAPDHAHIRRHAAAHVEGEKTPGVLDLVVASGLLCVSLRSFAAVTIRVDSQRESFIGWSHLITDFSAGVTVRLGVIRLNQVRSSPL